MHNKSIIIVESDAEDRNALKKLLLSESHQVVDFSDSMGVIQWIMENGKPLLLVAEESASPLNGWQTMDYIRAELLLTFPTLIVRSTEAEISNRTMQGVLTKPYSEKTLEEVINFLDSLEIDDDPDETATSYSVDYLKELADGNEEFIIESLLLFKQSVASKLQELQTALDGRELDKVRKIAHSIKPSFQMVLNHNGKDLCQTIEHTEEEAALTSLVHNLNKEFQLINTQITEDYQLEIN